jgi:hypothetical protein
LRPPHNLATILGFADSSAPEGDDAAIDLDVYNLFNANTPQVFQRNYTPPSTTPRSTYLDPLSIMSARFFKISAQFDF